MRLAIARLRSGRNLGPNRGLVKSGIIAIDSHVPVMFQSGMGFLTSSQTAADVARGVSRMLLQQGFNPILEFTLANGRRLDVAALGADGTLLGVEIKVALADLRSDTKWRDYLEFWRDFV